MTPDARETQVETSSFRDPSGFVFYRDGALFRQVNKVYRESYDLAAGSGLYAALIAEGLLIAHEEVSEPAPDPEIAYRVLKPEPVRSISYPYEWCFSQLKDAALATLRIQRRCIEFGLSLRDASAYNIQFYRGRPVFIDSLSFEKLREDQPWVAYGQFCRHFLAPLALISRVDGRFGQLTRIHLDGIPLDLAGKLLPRSSRFNLALLTHIHLHARATGADAGPGRSGGGRTMGKMALLGLLDHLEGAIQRLQWKPEGTEWGDYYDETNYSRTAFERKQEIVAALLDRLAPSGVWDLGANTGVFSRVASGLGIPTIAWDIDPAAVEKNYLDSVQRRDENLLPLRMDLTNPSPAIGWANAERRSWIERGPVDTALALALIHHLAIANNVPLPRIADLFARICKSLIVEFVPKSDSQVQRMLSSREDIFTDYAQEGFEAAFRRRFTIEERVDVRDSQRVVYLMRVREGGA